MNCLALQKDLIAQLPPLSILTPHPKEFDRLFGQHSNDFDRNETALKKAMEFNVVIVLKSHHTLIASPDGHQYYNNTGNAGMAKGGSGDVLTGMITAFVAQQYHPVHAAILGVYMHGLAGDFAAEALSMESMTAGELLQYLYICFRKIAAFPNYSE